MGFNKDLDLTIFNSLLEKRSEISFDELKRNLELYYLPFVKKLIQLKQQKRTTEGLLIGVSAIQGAGKTTQGEILEILLNHFGFPTESLSIDDHYITHERLCALRQKDPRFIRRGVTHDIALAKRDLKKLQTMEEEKPILISGYDKGANQGDGDRFRWVNPQTNLHLKAKVVQKELMVNKTRQIVKALQLSSAQFANKELVLLDDMGSDLPIFDGILPTVLGKFLPDQTDELIITMLDDETVHFSGKGEVVVDKKELPNGWRVVAEKPAFIFYDGWMLGARSMPDESVFDLPLPALETAEAKQFAKDVNKKLKDYEILWQMLEFLNVLYVPNYQMALTWRDQAEEVFRAKGEGMNHEQIKEFVYYFWRSVHPAIHIKNLAQDMEHTNQVVIINDDHSVREILSPHQVGEKYP